MGNEVPGVKKGPLGKALQDILAPRSSPAAAAAAEAGRGGSGQRGGGRAGGRGAGGGAEGAGAEEGRPPWPVQMMVRRGEGTGQEVDEAEGREGEENEEMGDVAGGRGGRGKQQQKLRAGKKHPVLLWSAPLGSYWPWASYRAAGEAGIKLLRRVWLTDITATIAGCVVVRWCLCIKCDTIVCF